MRRLIGAIKIIKMNTKINLRIINNKRRPMLKNYDNKGK